MVLDVDWPWPWPPHEGMKLQPPRLRHAFSVTHVIYDLGRGEAGILVDMVADRVSDTTPATITQLEAAGWREATPGGP